MLELYVRRDFSSILSYSYSYLHSLGKPEQEFSRWRRRPVDVRADHGPRSDYQHLQRDAPLRHKPLLEIRRGRWRIWRRGANRGFWFN